MTAYIKKHKRNRWLNLALLFLFFIIAILCYYQLLYKSPRVENDIVKPALVFNAHTAQARGIRFSPDGTMMASGSVDGTVRLWRKDNGTVIRTLQHPQGVTYLDYSPDGVHIASTSYDGIVRIWRVSDGLLVKELRGHQNTVWCTAFSPDGKTLASGGNDATVRLWDVTSGKLLHVLQGHSRIVWSVKFSPDNTILVSASFDATIKFWNISNGHLIQTNNGHSETVVDAAFSSDGKILASTSDDKTIKLWRMPEVKLIRTMKVAEHVQAVIFSPDDKRLLTAGRDKPMIGEFLQEIFGDSEFNRGVSMRLWDVKTGTLLQTFTQHSNDVNDIAYSRDGLWIASASEDNTVRLWHSTR